MDSKTTKIDFEEYFATYMKEIIGSISMKW